MNFFDPKFLLCKWDLRHGFDLLAPEYVCNILLNP
jgi:hypothetical protein